MDKFGGLPGGGNSTIRSGLVKLAVVCRNPVLLLQLVRMDGIWPETMV